MASEVVLVEWEGLAVGGVSFSPLVKVEQMGSGILFPIRERAGGKVAYQ